MGYFDNLTSDCREKFVDMTAEYLEFIQNREYEAENFKAYKQQTTPEYNSESYSKYMLNMQPRIEKLLEDLQNHNSISDHFISSLNESCQGAIVRKILKHDEQQAPEIKKSLATIIDDYIKIYKKYYPDENISTTLKEYGNRRDRYQKP